MTVQTFVFLMFYLVVLLEVRLSINFTNPNLNKRTND